MKILLAFILIIALSGCNESDVAVKQQKPMLFNNDPFYKTNIDTSLKFQSYIIDSSKFVTRYRISQTCHTISDSSKYYYSIITHYLQKGTYNKDSFYKYQNLYCRSRNHKHKPYDKNETPIHNIRIAVGIIK